MVHEEQSRIVARYADKIGLELQPRFEAFCQPVLFLFFFFSFLLLILFFMFEYLYGLSPSPAP